MDRPWRKHDTGRTSRSLHASNAIQFQISHAVFRSDDLWGEICGNCRKYERNE